MHETFICFDRLLPRSHEDGARDDILDTILRQSFQPLELDCDNAAAFDIIIDQDFQSWLTLWEGRYLEEVHPGDRLEAIRWLVKYIEHVGDGYDIQMMCESNSLLEEDATKRAEMLEKSLK